MDHDVERLNPALAGRYRLLHRIGQGGMATVFQAEDLKHQRLVALKVLKPELAAALGGERFLREIRLTARLDHPHILPLLDSGEAGGLLYYVMPYVAGESLRDRLKREKQLPLEDALTIARDVADALGYAHSHGIIHRDIKPENILLAGGHARVADFGIARAATVAGSEALTETGLALGTPAYMSPEQASGERDVDARTDIYGLACVVYEMLAGQPPFTGATARVILARKALDAVPSLRIVRETVPPAVERAIARALARVPADRFTTAPQFVEALGDSSRTTLPLPTTGRRGHSPGKRLLMAGVGMVAVAVLLFTANAGGLRDRLTKPPDAPRIESLAVLPLENLSGDAQQDYFAAGMHEALIVNLGRLSGLRRVSARPSVLRYQASDKPLRQIASELGVSALVTGTVLLSGNRVRITAHLIDPATEQALWGNSYERELRDVLVLQNEIVAAIAREVQLQLSPSEQAGLARVRRVNPAAYEAYLKGMFQIKKFTPEGFEAGMALLHEAVTIDSAESLAYAGLAEGYTLMELFTPSPPSDASDRAKAAALKAVELDETLAQAHVALGDYQGSKEWDFAAAERSYQRALSLNPNLPEAHIHYAWNEAIFGREEKALAEMKRGVELDPLSPLYTAWLGGMYWEFGRYDEAIVEAREALQLHPDFPVALFVLGLAQLDRGRYQEAIEAHERALAKYPRQMFSWTLARTYALAGRPVDARRIMAGLESGNPVEDIVHPWFIAAAYAALNDKEKALDWLERAFDARIMFIANLGRERAAGFDLQPLHSHSRYQALLRRLKLQAGRQASSH